MKRRPRSLQIDQDKAATLGQSGHGFADYGAGQNVHGVAEGARGGEQVAGFDGSRAAFDGRVAPAPHPAGRLPSGRERSRMMKSSAGAEKVGTSEGVDAV